MALPRRPDPVRRLARGPARASVGNPKPAMRSVAAKAFGTAPKPAPRPAPAPAARPADTLKNPEPWTPTLDAGGIQDEADITNRYNQDKVGLDTNWGDQLNSFTRQYTTASEAFAERNKDIARNAASRGMGRSGIRNQNDLESGVGYQRQVGDIDTARTSAETTYTNALKNLATNRDVALERNRITSGQRSQDAYNASVAGSYVAPEQPNAPGTGVKMSWAEFRKKHPSSKTPAQVAALRQKYDRWVKNAR